MILKKIKMNHKVLCISNYMEVLLTLYMYYHKSPISFPNLWQIEYLMNNFRTKTNFKLEWWWLQIIVKMKKKMMLMGVNGV